MAKVVYKSSGASGKYRTYTEYKKNLPKYSSSSSSTMGKSGQVTGAVYVDSTGKLTSTAGKENREINTSETVTPKQEAYNKAQSDLSAKTPGIYRLSDGSAVVSSLGEGTYNYNGKAFSVKVPVATGVNGRPLYKNQIGTQKGGAPIISIEPMPTQKTYTTLPLNQFDVSTPEKRAATQSYLSGYGTAGNLFKTIDAEQKRGYTPRPDVNVPFGGTINKYSGFNINRYSTYLYREKKVIYGQSAEQFKANLDILSRNPVTTGGGKIIESSGRFTSEAGYTFQEVQDRYPLIKYTRFGLPGRIVGKTGAVAREEGVNIQTQPYTEGLKFVTGYGIGRGIGYGTGKVVRYAENTKTGAGLITQRTIGVAGTGLLTTNVVVSTPKQLADQSAGFVGGFGGIQQGYLRGVREKGIGKKVSAKSAGTIPVKDYSVYRNINELKAFEGQTVRASHISVNKDIFVKDRVDFITMAKPEFAGARKSVSSYGTFFSAPPSPAQKVNIASSLRTSITDRSGARPFYSLENVNPVVKQNVQSSYSFFRGKNYDYLSYGGIGKGSVSSDKPSVLPGTRISSLNYYGKVETVPKSVISRGAKSINEYILQQNTNKLYIPGENYAGSREGQFVIPARVSKEMNLGFESSGVRVTQVGKNKFYTVSEDSRGIISDFFRPPDTRAVQIIKVKITPVKNEKFSLNVFGEKNKASYRYLSSSENVRVSRPFIVPSSVSSSRVVSSRMSLFSSSSKSSSYPSLSLSSSFYSSSSSGGYSGGIGSSSAGSSRIKSSVSSSPISSSIMSSPGSSITSSGYGTSLRSPPPPFIPSLGFRPLRSGSRSSRRGVKRKSSYTRSFYEIVTKRTGSRPFKLKGGFLGIEGVRTK